MEPPSRGGSPSSAPPIPLCGDGSKRSPVRSGCCPRRARSAGFWFHTCHFTVTVIGVDVPRSRDVSSHRTSGAPFGRHRHVGPLHTSSEEKNRLVPRCGNSTGFFTFTKKVALQAAVWPVTAAASRPAARVDGLYIVLVESVIILIGLDVNLRANGLAVSQRASADQGDAYGEKALSGLRRR